jgi:hypothetical protein
MQNSFIEEKMDRREIYRKIHKHRQEQRKKLKGSGSGFCDEDDYVSPDDSNNESFRGFDDDQPAEEEVGEEDYEAMNHALSSPPVAWWQMRKQWQAKPNMAKLFGRSGGAEEEEGDDIDASYRLGNLVPTTAMDGGVVSHPVMLADPSSMGYHGGSYRQNPFAQDKNKKNEGKYRNLVMYVPKALVHKRRFNQIAYIAGALCAVMLFSFLLQQRKLAGYAMMESPMSLSAYLAGETTPTGSRASVDSIQLVPVPKGERSGLHEEALVKGIEQFERSGIRDTTSTIGLKGSSRYTYLRSLMVSQGITSDETFDNPLSPQHKALDWMAYQDLHTGPPLRYGHDEYAAKKMIQRYALVTTYYATNGPGWYKQHNFLSERDECEWNDREEGYFIGAGDCNNDGFITALALWGNNLVGALPEELGTLSTITTFSLYDNNMRGPPPRILEKLAGLKILHLNKNQFEGSLDYLCHLNIEVMKADCGEKGGVTCSCCTECGWNKHKEGPLRFAHGRNVSF